MPRPIRVGVQIHPQHADYAAIRSAVAAAGRFERDHTEYGCDFGTAGSRLADLGAVRDWVAWRDERNARR